MIATSRIHVDRLPEEWNFPTAVGAVTHGGSRPHFYHYLNVFPYDKAPIALMRANVNVLS